MKSEGSVMRRSSKTKGRERKKVELARKKERRSIAFPFPDFRHPKKEQKDLEEI